VAFRAALRLDCCRFCVSHCANGGDVVALCAFERLADGADGARLFEVQVVPVGYECDGPAVCCAQSASRSWWVELASCVLRARSLAFRARRERRGGRRIGRRARGLSHACEP